MEVCDTFGLMEDPPTRRRGARSPHLVPSEVLAQLHRGDTETVNLMEQIAMSFPDLSRSVFPNATETQGLGDPRLVYRMRAGGRLVLDRYGSDMDPIRGHPSDTVRAWGAMAVGAVEVASLGDRLSSIRHFADDSHFAVREWAWISIRPWIVLDLPEALDCLSSWVEDASPFIRRFAIEGTRPRSVWARHIPALKENPALAMHLLEPLADDPHPYVQDAVANWLNDASRSQPLWVAEVCREWSYRYGSAGAQRIQRRALRTIRRAVAEYP